MAKKQPTLPPDLTAFIKQDETTFHCDDGDWDLRIEPCEKSDFKDELPPRSTMIAENGSGDCLFLKTSAAGKIDPRVFVYWHEEERDEVFAKVGDALGAIEGLTIASRAQLLGAYDVNYREQNFLVRVTAVEAGVYVSAVDPRGLPAAGEGPAAVIAALKTALGG